MLVGSILRTQSNFYDGPFLRKQWTTFSRYFSEKSSIVDVLLDFNKDVKEFSSSNILGSKVRLFSYLSIQNNAGSFKKKVVVIWLRETNFATYEMKHKFKWKWSYYLLIARSTKNNIKKIKFPQYEYSETRVERGKDAQAGRSSSCCTLP